MTIWRHKDAQTISFGGLGCLGLFISAILIVTALLSGQPVENREWFIAGICALIVTWFVAKL